jgi:hypothetical protein
MQELTQEICRQAYVTLKNILALRHALLFETYIVVSLFILGLFNEPFMY